MGENGAREECGKFDASAVEVNETVIMDRCLDSPGRLLLLRPVPHTGAAPWEPRVVALLWPWFKQIGNSIDDG